MTVIPQAVQDAERRLQQAAQQPQQPRTGNIPDAVLQAELRLQQPQDSGANDVTVSQPAEDDDRSLLNRSLRRAGADILSTPGQLAGLLSLGGAAFETYVTGSTDSFTEAVLSDEARPYYRMLENPNALPEAQAAAAQQLSQMGTDALRPGMRIADEWLRWGEGVTNAQRAEGDEIPLDEELGGLALSTLLTLPVLPARAATAARLTTAQRMRNFATTVAEVATPITITRRNASAAEIAATQGINLAVGGAITELSRTFSGETTIADVLRGENPEPTLDAEEYYGTGAAIAGTSALGFGLAAALRPGRVADNIARAGDNYGVSRLGNTQGINTDADYALDDLSIVRNTMEQTNLGADVVEDMDNALRATRTQTTDIQYSRLYEHGYLDPEGSVRTTPLRVVLENFRSLRPEDRELFNSAYEAADELGRRQRPGYTPSFGADITDSVLNQRLQAGRSNPRVRAMMDQYEQVMRDVTEARFQSGMISRQQYIREKARGAYMHNIEVDPSISPMRRAASRLFRNMNSNLLDITGSEKLAQGGLRAKENPMDALGTYLQQQISSMQQNKVRGQVLRALDRRALRDADGNATGKMAVRRLKDDATAPQGTQTVVVMDRGKEVRYAVGDVRLANALRFRPRAALPLFNEMRRIFQTATTGNANPLFAPVSAAYDLSAGMLGMRTNRMVSGIIDQKLKEGMDALGFSDSVTNTVRTVMAGAVRPAELPFNFVEGTLQGLRGRMLELQATRALEVAERLGTPMARQAAVDALRLFDESMYAKALRAGYSSGSFSEAVDGADDMLSIMRSRLNNARVSRMYVGALDAIRDSARMAAFARNYAHTVNKNGGPNNVTAKDMKRIAGEVRNMGADVSRQSGHQAINATLSAIPYGNVIVQSTAHLLHNVMTNPAAWSTIAAVAGMRLMHESSLSPEAYEYLRTTIPAYRQTDEFWYEVRDEGEPFNPDEHLRSFKIGPELGFITSVTSNFLGAMLEGAGIAEGQDDPVGGLGGQAQALAALGDMIGFTTPPLLNVTANAFGYGNMDIPGAMRGDALFREPRLDNAQEDFRGYGLSGGIMGDRMALMLNSALGTAGRVLSETLEVMLDHPAGTMSAEAMRDAMDVAVFNAVERQEVGKLFSNAVIAEARTTPLSNAAYELDRALEEVANYARTNMVNISAYNDADLYGGRGLDLMVERLDDPLLAQQASILREYLLSPAHAQEMEAIGQAKIRQHRLRGNVDLPVSERNRELNAINREIQERFERVLVNYGDFEQYMRQSFGDGWSIEGFMRDARRNLQD